MAPHLTWRIAWIPLSAFAVLCAFTLPMLISGLEPGVRDQVIALVQKDGTAAVLRTSLFALFCSGITVSLGFFGALGLKSVDPRTERALIILALPLLAGDVATGFVLKLTLSDLIVQSNAIMDRRILGTWGLLAIAQVAQLLPLASYIIARRLRAAPRAYLELAETSRLSVGERIRDIYLPLSRSVIVLLTLLCAIFAALEYSKSELILKPSPGTGTELISHVLVRVYTYHSLVDPTRAFDITLALGGIFIACIVILVFVSVRLNLWILGTFGRWAAIGDAFRWLGKLRVAYGFSVVLATIAVAPFLALAVRTGGETTNPLFAFGANLAQSVLVSLLLGALAVAFSVSSRLAWPNYLANLTGRSSRFFVAVLGVKLLPAICLAFVGYQWLSWLSVPSNSFLGIFVIWVLGQLILGFPLVAAFALYVQFAVSTSELEFQRCSRASVVETGLVSFIRRFGLEYVFIGLMAFTLVWNESTLNTVFDGWSRDIPSLAVELTRRVEGRSGSYAEAAVLVFAGLAPVVVAILLWQWLPGRTEFRRGSAK